MASTIHVQLHQRSPSASEAAMGSHSVRIDRPESKGGTGTGPMGGELFLASVGGCFLSNLLAAAKARDTAAKDIHVSVTGTLAEAPARFSSLHLLVTWPGAEPDGFRKLVAIADSGCIMMNTLRGKLPVQIETQTSLASKEHLVTA